MQVPLDKISELGKLENHGKEFGNPTIIPRVAESRIPREEYMLNIIKKVLRLFLFIEKMNPKKILFPIVKCVWT